MLPEALQGALGPELGGAFYLHGDDEYRKEEAASLLVEAHLEPGTRDFNFDVFRGSELELEHLASVAATLPMMSSFRVVLVREVEALTSSPRARELLTGLVEEPPEGLALVLLARVPRRSSARFYKTLKEKARSLEFRSLSENDVPGWLMTRSRERYGVEFDEHAARALAAALGSDLGLLSHEVEKLATLEGEGGRITLETVERVGTRLPKQDRWQWFDLVGSRRFGEALQGLPVLLEHGENGVGLTIGLATHLLRVGVAMETGDEGLSMVLSRHQNWLASRYRAQARGWTATGLARAIRKLRDLDARLKSSPLPDAHHLESWLLERMAEAGEEAGGRYVPIGRRS